MNPSPHVVSPRPGRSLAAELAHLREALAERPVSLREIIAVLEGRAYELLMLLFVLPFLLPVSVPGVSTPFGLAVATIAVQLALGRLPWLPRWLLDRRLPPGFFVRVLSVTQGVVRFLERVLRPRWPAVTGAGWLITLHLLVVVAAALLLALPLPIPFTNTLPGWTVLFFATGLMEKDGLAIAAGYASMIATLVLFFALGAAITQSISATWHWFTG